MEPAPDPQPTRIRSVELRVSDVERSAGFYERVVGLETRALSGGAAALAAPGGGPVLLSLSRAETPGQAPVRAAGLFHTAFRYPTRSALATALARLASGGDAALTGASDHGVSEALYLDDPDGLGIELYWDRPRAQWPQASGEERVHMFTAPLDLNDLVSAADPEGTAADLDIGHVHLKVADPDAATRFWTENVSMELMTMFGDQAAFLAFDGYHHHIGANSWYSAGAPLEPAEGPGLDAVVIEADGPELTTPDGITIRREQRG